MNSMTRRIGYVIGVGSLALLVSSSAGAVDAGLPPGHTLDSASAAAVLPGASRVGATEGEGVASEGGVLRVDGEFVDLVDAASSEISEEELPAGLHYVESVFAPGSTTEQRVYATDAYFESRTDREVPMGPVLVVAVNSLPEGSLPESRSPLRAADRAMTSGETVEVYGDPIGGSHIEVTDGENLVQVAVVNYSVENAIDFLEAVSR